MNHRITLVAAAFLVILPALALPTSAAAQAPEPTKIQIPLASAAPVLSDYLTGGSKPGLKITDFRQREPKDLAPVSRPTTAYLSYDRLNIYAAFVCEEPASELRARMTKREDINAEDLVGLYLDTFHDKQRAYLFYASPVGVQADGIMSESQGEDFSFDTQWSSDAKITADGYVVLITVPLKSLRFPSTADGKQEWGVGLVRALRSQNETAFWPANTSTVNGFIAQFSTATGLAQLKPGRNLQAIPYGTFAGARFLDMQEGTYLRKNEGRAGVDVKFVPRDAVTLDFTANPDFSQVESDEPQVTVNQRFEVFFPEKRPFFLENSDYFQAPTTLLFSRRLRDPQFGARMTAKFGKWSAGALAMDDRAPGRLVDASSSAFGKRSFNTAGTAKYVFDNQSTIGFFATTRNFGSAENQVGSINAHIRLNANWFFDAEATTSRDVSLAGAKGTGRTLFAGLQRSGRGLSYTLSYNDVSPNFKAPLGFVPRTDMRDLTSFLSYRWRPKTGPVTAFGPNSYVEAIWNHAGQLEDWIVRFPFSVSFKARTDIFARHAIISETVGGLRFRQREDLIQVSSSHLRWLSVDATLAAGTRPNYYPANGVAPFLGNYVDVNAGVNFKPTAALSLSETFLWSRLNGSDAAPSTARVFSNVLWRSRINYQFTREWSLRAILDYNSLDPNRALVALERGRHFGTDVLLTWLLHPGTALYVGYTDGYDNVALDPSKRVFTTDGALNSTGRQLFIKTSWLFRL